MALKVIHKIENLCITIKVHMKFRYDQILNEKDIKEKFILNI